MSWLKWALLIYVALSIRLVHGQTLARFEFCPDGTLILAVLALLTIEHPLAFAFASLIALAGDLLWGDRLGATMCAVLIVGYWLGGVRQWFREGSPIHSALAATFLTGLILFVRAVVARMLDHSPMDYEAMGARAAVDGAVAGAVLVAIQAVLIRIHRAFYAVFLPGSAG
jgi:hypothetical protein